MHNVPRADYDDVGNRLSETKPSATTTYNYDSADRVTSSVTGSATRTYAHDANGNMAAAGPKTYTYDQGNRMTSAIVGGTTHGYGYDGSGIRVSASGGGAPSNYIWDENNNLPMLVGESNGGSSFVRRHVYGHDLISSTTPSATSYFHHDGIGSVTNVTNSSGVPQWSYGYEPFGSSRTATKVNPVAPDNPMRFTGEYLDPTGLYHLRARQMDTSLGRFTKMDPYAPSILNPFVSAYLYASSRPTFFVDPSGLTIQQALDLMLADVHFGLGPPDPACGMYRCPVEPDAFDMQRAGSVYKRCVEITTTAPVWATGIGAGAGAVAGPGAGVGAGAGLLLGTKIAIYGPVACLIPAILRGDA
ncbi:MAG: hypothetical protein M3277_07605 [Actinomycetota bacterium]|nr:hypothetical protein [Actinomycetota bacterium]